MQKLYPEAEILNMMQVHRVVLRFEQTGSATNIPGDHEVNEVK